MKFGLRLHEFVIPKWDGHYIDYNGLCQKIRDSTHQAGTSDLTKALKYLEENITSFETFRLPMLESIVGREKELCYAFGFPSTPSTLPNISSVNCVELRIVQAAYDELLIELKQLQWFDKVNYAAMQKLFSKLYNCGYDKSNVQHYYSRWMTLQKSLQQSWFDTFSRIDKIVTEIQQESSKPLVGTHSWYIARVFSQAFPDPSHDTTQESFTGDRHSLLEKCIGLETVQHTMKRNDAGFSAGDVFLISLLFSGNNTTALALQAIPSEHISEEQVFQVLQIYGLGFLSSQGYKQEFHGTLFDKGSSQFLSLLNSLGPDVADILQRKDGYGCLLLHYAVKYGLNSVCEFIVSRLIAIGTAAVGQTLIAVDHNGDTPLHCAVVTGNSPVLAILLKALPKIHVHKKTMASVRTVLGDILVLAVKSKEIEMVKNLLQHGPELLHQSVRGETALYCASRIGNIPLTQLFLSHLSQDKLSVDLVEKSRGWTPLMVACANGHAAIAELLLQAGAKLGTLDHRGWTALEHAIFRGHHTVAEVFKPDQSNPAHEGPASAVRTFRPISRYFCNEGEKLLIVHLGSTQGGHDRAAIQLGGSNPNGTCKPSQQCRLELQISLLGNHSAAKILQLPMLEDQLHKPLVFRVKEGTPLQIVVKAHRYESISSKVFLSSGTSLLDQGDVLGEKHESLIRERTIYMMDKESSAFAGAVLLSYVVATPFSGLEKDRTSKFMKTNAGPVQLIGHRGLGQNFSSRSFLQLGENTATSFLSAAKLGASFVEFDLQVTRDLEAVVYHDFSLSESGTDIPIHDTTLAQYKHVSGSHEPQRQVSYSTRETIKSSDYPHRKPRALSSGEESLSKAAELRNRLRYTVDFQTKGFKPNSRGDVIQDSLATLKELLVNMPLEIGFNIEIKYPRLHETAEAGVAPVALNINTFIGVALKTVQTFGGHRQIILSSFTPEVCILLSVKQAAYPVMFITNAGKVPMQDKELRAASLQAAVHFSRTWNLAGIVFASETLLYCPRLVQFVKNMGLACASYGLLNNDPINARVQVAAGVDILLVDRVKLIADHIMEFSQLPN